MHLLLIYPYPYYYTNPTISYILEELKQKEDLIITLLIPDEEVIASVENERIVSKKFTFNVTWPIKFWKWIPIFYQYIWLLWYCKMNKVSKIIGTDPVGLIVAGRVGRLLNSIEVHYFSFEILFNSELSNNKYFRSIKKKEIKYNRLVSVLVIQDEVRKNLLFEENSLDEMAIKVYFIPVAPVQHKSNDARKEILRSELGIEEDEIILLHSGSVAKWSGVEVLIDLLKIGLPSKFKLIIHCKHTLSRTNPLHSELMFMEENGYPLILHDDTFSDYGDYLNFLACGNYGIAIYVNDSSSPYTGRNIEEIGLASGKFSAYVSQGIPTFVTHAGIYQELNQKYNFGIIIKDAEDIKNALINQELHQFNKEDILNLYRNELDPGKFSRSYLEHVFEKMDKI